ncbi:hypothetical protein CEXT_458041 [Caerostris extrusa]|uniref:Uncharacterized protein n=1 Tax=Caerostris extrusa TaxID=172846 RepID=A0AAV4WUD9_CAEEX|nr:hypothetical protein CEXT_458041 [Caerostris extrusa]
MEIVPLLQEVLCKITFILSVPMDPNMGPTIERSQSPLSLTTPCSPKKQIKSKPFTDGGIPAPFDNNGRPLKIFKSKTSNVRKTGSSNEVRIIHREKRSPLISLKSRTSNYESASKNGKDGTPITQTFIEPQPIVEEFEQGEAADSGRQKRLTDILNKQWVTEKIIEGSDPVENIDDENYIEEINEDPFLLKEPSLEPIIVEDQTSEVESTFTTIQELQEIQIID